MALVLQTLKDSSYEHVVKITTSGTNSATAVVDASELEGAATNPRLSIVACQWSVGSQTDVLFNATTDVVALSLNGSGSWNCGSQSLPTIPNNGGTGVNGDVNILNGSASAGFIILKLRKVSGFANTGTA